MKVFFSFFSLNQLFCLTASECDIITAGQDHLSRWLPTLQVRLSKEGVSICRGIRSWIKISYSFILI